MFIGIAMFFVLMLMGGLIAFLGDKIGSKVGKKRMTLFGLRPKYTSIIVTIISGVLISFLTVAVLAVVNENVRVALFGLSKLQAQMANLNQEIIVKNKELDEGKKQLEARNKEYEGVTKKSEKTVKELERVESQRAYVQSGHSVGFEKRKALACDGGCYHFCTKCLPGSAGRYPAVCRRNRTVGKNKRRTFR